MNAPKQKGTRHESAVRDYLLSRGVIAYRPAQAGFADVGDIHGVSPFIIQAKDWRDLAGALREGVDGAVKQARNADQDYGVAVIKRARKPVEDAYAVMRLQDWTSVFIRLHNAEARLASIDSGMVRSGW